MSEITLETNLDALDFAAVSHLGHRRQRNQDSWFVASDRGFALVADGVGGQGDGAWASQRAVELIVQKMKMLGHDSADETAVLEMIQSVHCQMRAEDPRAGGKASGTTIAGIWAPQGAAGQVMVFNVGDSSVFHVSQGKMVKLSRDHSLYQLWLDGGSVGREPAKRVIVQALGISEHLTPYLVSVRLLPGDHVLICTDGLSGQLTVERMEALLTSADSSQNACDRLLEDVLSGPAADNITVSVCYFLPRDSRGRKRQVSK